MHKTKKLSVSEWVCAVRSGKLTAAVKRLRPINKRGPWYVLCDNEKFLKAAESQSAYATKGIKLWSIPARSPDLNPIEMFWAWLRKELRKRDLEDLRLKRPVLRKTLYIRRVRSVLRTRKAQTVAARIARSLKSKCKEVVAKKGAAARS